MPAETLAFETAKDGFGAFTRAASSIFGSVTKRRVGGLKEGVIGLGGGHHVARLGAGEGMSILDTSRGVSRAVGVAVADLVTDPL